MNAAELKNLSFGDVVQDPEDGERYVVTAFAGETVIALAAVNIAPLNGQNSSRIIAVVAVSAAIAVSALVYQASTLSASHLIEPEDLAKILKSQPAKSRC